MVDEFDARDPETESQRLARFARRAAIIGLVFPVLSFLALGTGRRAHQVNGDADPDVARSLDRTFLLAIFPAGLMSLWAAYIAFELLVLFIADPKGALGAFPAALMLLVFVGASVLAYRAGMKS